MMRSAAILSVFAVVVAAPAAVDALAARAPSKLPPGSLRGPAHRLNQYPNVSLASAEQRLAAQRLVDTMWATVRRWRNPRLAAAAGFRMRRARRRAGDRSILWFHAEHRRLHGDRV